MGLLSDLLARRNGPRGGRSPRVSEGASDCEAGDAVVVVRRQPGPAAAKRGAKLVGDVTLFLGLGTAGPSGGAAGPSGAGHVAIPAPAAASARPRRATCLADLPCVAACEIWAALGREDQRACRLVSRAARGLFGSGVRRLHLHAADLAAPGGLEALARLPDAFPDLNELHLHTAAGAGGQHPPAAAGASAAAAAAAAPTASSGNKFDQAALLLEALRALKRPAGGLRHLHTFSLDAKLRGEALLAAARLLVRHPGLKHLLLPHQRACGSAEDARVLGTLLEALPGLEELDLGCSPAPGAGAACANALTPAVWQRVLRLRRLRSLTCNASGVPDAQLAGLAALPGLRQLSLSACGAGDGLAAALGGLGGSLAALELEHPTLGDQLVGVVGGLRGLQVLSLGLCPKLTGAICPEVCGLSALEKLTVPFPLDSGHLRLLSRLPALRELFSWRSVELDVLGPAHEPLANVRQLVASGINGRGKPLAAWFPGLEAVCLKRCSDMAALSLRGCCSLQALVAGEAAGLTNEGLACLAGLKGLSKLQLEGASQLSDAGFTSVFGATMPALQQVTLGGCPGVSDRSLQLLTASCRRLSSISLSGCPLLTDKTLKRLSHCEHLGNVSLRGCKGFTAEGVAALAAAPQVRSVHVHSCPGVRASACRAAAAAGGCKLRVE